MMDADLDADVMPNDFIVVPQMKKIYVNGEVKKAGEFPYEKGLTVHKVITMAGGFTDKAAIGARQGASYRSGRRTIDSRPVGCLSAAGRHRRRSTELFLRMTASAKTDQVPIVLRLLMPGLKTFVVWSRMNE